MENKDSVPFCRPIPTGVIPAEGATLQSLNLSAGYYRVSNSSHKVLECLREEACQGGEVAGDYCVEGYEGQCESLWCRLRLLKVLRLLFPSGVMCDRPG